MTERDFKTMKDVFETIELKFEDVNGTRKVTSVKSSETVINTTYSGLEGVFASHELPETGAIGLQTPQPTIQEQTANGGGALEPGSLGLGAQPTSHDNGASTSTAAVGNSMSSPNVASALLELADPGWRHPPPIEAPHEGAPLVGTSDEEEEDEVTNQLSCRLGKLQVTHGGQLRYFGSTSNFTLLDVLVEVAPASPISITRGTQETLENAGLALDVDETFEKHLLQLYFTWHDPCMHAMSEDVFWRSRAQKMHEGVDTPYYSRALSDAM
jgi:hypothetical protein